MAEDEGMEEDAVMREFKEEEKDEVENEEVMEDLETSLRRAAEVIITHILLYVDIINLQYILQVLVDSFDESIVYLNNSIKEDRRRSILERDISAVRIIDVTKLKDI